MSDTPTLQKEALGPNPSQIINAAKTIGVPAAIGGAGIAGLVAALSEMRKQREAQEPPTPRRDVLEVQLPQVKVASVLGRLGSLINSPGRALAAATTTAVAGTGLAAAGPSILASLKAKVSGQDAGTAFVNAAPSSSPSPSYAFEAPLMAGMAAGGLVGGYSLVDSILKARRRRDAAARLEKSKQEYSQLLGQTLTGPASLKTAAFPLCEEMVRLMSGMVAAELNLPINGTTKIASSEWQKLLAIATSTPMLVALGAAAASHQFMYNREKDVENSMTAKRVTPPKEIRLVSAPAAPALPAPAAKEEEPATIKAAEMLIDVPFKELLGGGRGVSKAPVAGDINSDGKPDAIAPKVERVDANTYRVITPAGAVTVDATDPNTRHILEKDHSRLAEILSGISALPAPDAARI